MILRLFAFLLSALVMISTLVAGARSQERFSAWQLLKERDPAIADDASIDWRQRLILHALTPRQAEEYFSGRASAEELILEDGRTLAAVLRERESPAAGVYVPLAVACRLFEAVVEEPAANQPGPERSFQLASSSLSAQGGSASGCPMPPDALAVVLQLRAQGAGAVQPRIKLWSAGYPEPASAAFEGGGDVWSEERTATTIVNLCREERCLPAELQMRSSRAALVQGDLIGYFRPLSASDRLGPLPVFPLLTEGPSNNFFGTDAGAVTTGDFNSFFGGSAGANNTAGTNNSFFGHNAGLNNTASNNSFFGSAAGASNTIGTFNSFFGRRAGANNLSACCNSFFGTEAGRNNTTGEANSFFGDLAGSSNTTGGSNSFFGADAGKNNTQGNSNASFGDLAGLNNATGSNNSFFGSLAGISNTIENNNTFVGASSNGAAGITNSTALGHRAQVSQSNSLVLGSIAGVNGATASVNVGIGTPAPARQLHLRGNNATFRMDRDADTAAFILVRTNAGGDPLKTFVVGANASGANNGEFIINDLGQAVGGAGVRRMTINNAGEAHFTGNVQAPAFVTTSSLRYKENVEKMRHAAELVNRLEGVSFFWKETGRAAVGLIAEDVAEVIPQAVHRDEDDRASGVDYAALTAVLIEAVKSQREEIETQQQRIQAQQQSNGELRRQVENLERRLAALEAARRGGSD